MSKINFESPSVQSYLSILQDVIGRMGTNSAGCKTWCIALVSAIVVIISDKGNPNYAWATLIPIVLFFFLDAYYLGLERRFRERYDTFIRKLHSGAADMADVFIVTLEPGLGKTLEATFKACFSISVWPFYGFLFIMLIIVRAWIL